MLGTAIAGEPLGNAEWLSDAAFMCIDVCNVSPGTKHDNKEAVNTAAFVSAPKDREAGWPRGRG